MSRDLKAEVDRAYPRCPKCGNSLDNSEVAYSPGLMNCANCKFRWYIDCPSYGDELTTREEFKAQLAAVTKERDELKRLVDGCVLFAETNGEMSAKSVLAHILNSLAAASPQPGGQP